MSEAAKATSKRGGKIVKSDGCVWVDSRKGNSNSASVRLITLNQLLNKQSDWLIRYTLSPIQKAQLGFYVPSLLRLFFRISTCKSRVAVWTDSGISLSWFDTELIALGGVLLTGVFIGGPAVMTLYFLIFDLSITV